MKMKIPQPVGFLIFMAILFALGYLLPWTVVLGKAGLAEPEIARQLDIYSKLMFFIIGGMILYYANFLWKKNDKYGDNIGIFNKDETWFRRFTYGQITLLSLIFFSAFFLVANTLRILGDGFFGLKVLPQQFTPTDSLLISTFQIPIAENLMAAFSIGFIALILTILAVKYGWEKRDYKIYKYAAVTIGLAILGYVWHQSVYASSDVASTITAFFWGIGGYISLATGFFVPFLVMHMTNNFFIDFSRIYSSDVVFGTIIGVIVFLMIIYYALYRKRLWGGKNG